MRVVCLLLPLFLAPSFVDLKKAYDEAVRASDWKSVKLAAQSLAALKTDVAAQFLGQQLQFAREEAHQRAVFEAFAFMEFPGIEDFLDSQVNSDDPFRRAMSVKALARRDKQRGLRLASNLLELDDDARARRIAVDVLADIGDAAAASALMRLAPALPVAEQLRITRALKGFPEGALLGARRMLYDADPDVRLFAALAILARPSPAFQTEITNSLKKESDARVRLILAATLDKLQGGTATGAATLRNAIGRAKKFGARYEVYDLIARAQLSDDAIVKHLTKTALSGDKRIRPKAAETLGHAGGSAAVPTLAKLLRQPRPWQVAVGAARGLAATRSRTAIEPLVEALGKAKGRHAWELSKALESLTGQPFGEAADVWARWWKERGAGFQVQGLPDALWEEDTAGDDKYSFYGIRIRSQAVTFVCDKSGSMQGNKLKTLQSELLRILDRTPPSAKIRFIFFSNDKVLDAVPKTRLGTATKKLKKTGRARIEGLLAGGATNIWMALQGAMKDPDVDTIVLLSDGAPTAGKVRQPAQIRKRIREQNRERMILFHMIAIGHTAPHFRDLARESGGTYVRKDVR